MTSSVDGRATAQTTPRTARGRRTREALVTAARKVFERDGFLNARITDICSLAKVSHGTFYTYFTSKEEVFGVVVDGLELDLVTIQPAHDSTHDPIDRIRAANRHYLETYRENAKLMGVVHEVSLINEEVRKVRLDRQLAFAHAIERRIELFQAEGLADPEIDAWYAANALGGMVAFFAEYMLVQGVEFDFDKALEQLTLLWANSLGLPKG